MSERIEKIKKHFRTNKAVYISSGVCLVAGVAGGILTARQIGMVSNRQIQVLTYKSKQTLEVFIEALGDPGNIIQDTTTGTIYASQGQAGRELGLSPSRISEQLKGARDHVNGHIFSKLGKASVVLED